MINRAMRTRILLSAALFSCSEHHHGPPDPANEPPRPAPAAKPLELTWKAESISQDFTIAGGREHGGASAGKTGVDLELVDMDGASYEVGNQKGVVHGKIELVTVKGLAWLGPIAFRDLEHVDAGLTLKLELSDGRRGETKVPPLNFDLQIGDIFKTIDHGPVTFGAEPADPKPADALYDVDGLTSSRLYGKPAAVQNIDFIAIHTTLPAEKGRKICSGYTGRQQTLTLVLKETEVTIWNRRTGAVVAKQVFPPDRECPAAALDKAEQDHTADPTKIEAWLKTKVHG